jgi:hypothetical protein
MSKYLSCLSGVMETEFSKEHGIKYKDIKHKIKPLDLLVFHGPEVISTSIMYLQKLKLDNGDWSHVGMVVNTDILPNIPNGKKDRLYILESALGGDINDGVPDTNGETKLGVQIRDLEDVIKNYYKLPNTLVGWCKLKNNPCDQKPDESLEEYEERFLQLRSDFIDIYDEYGTKFFDVNPLNLFASLFPKLRCFRFLLNNTLGIGKDWLFCSELVGLIYGELGIIDLDELDPQDIVPVDFTSGKDEDGLIPFHKLPPVILIP